MVDELLKSILERYPNGCKKLEEAVSRLKNVLYEVENEFSDVDEQDLIRAADEIEKQHSLARNVKKCLV